MMPLRYCPSVPRQPPLMTTTVDEDHHCRGHHRLLLPSMMTAFALPLPSPSVAFAISVAIVIPLAANTIAKNKEVSKIVNDNYHRALRKPPLSKCVIFWQTGFLKVKYCYCGIKFPFLIRRYLSERMILGTKHFTESPQLHMYRGSTRKNAIFLKCLWTNSEYLNSLKSMSI